MRRLALRALLIHTRAGTRWGENTALMIIDYPLTKANRIALARAFRQAPRVDLTLDCVIEGQMGRAYVDDMEHPSAFKIRLGPFVYFAGDAAGPAAEEMLRSLDASALLMPSAPGWLEAAQRLWGARLCGLDRHSFSSTGLSVEHLRGLYAASRYRDRVRPMDAALVTSLRDKPHFIDLSEFDSAEDFLQRGAGFYVGKGAGAIGAVWASLACSRGIEVSLYVAEDYRRQGMATALASRLLLWCFENAMDPHWDAANPESAQLALKLGYAPAGGYTAYYLNE
jgi:GNAT superfamily N-acetyltransferase